MTVPVRVVLLCLSCFGSLRAAPVDLWFEQANRFYQQERFDSAEVYYRKAVGTGTVNAALLYNLGNACFRQNKMGEAILQYERAQRLAPTDPDIEHNLRFARANIVDRVSEPERGFVESVLRASHNAMTLQTQLWVFTGILLLLSVMIALSLYVSRNVRLWLTYCIALCVLALAAVGGSAGVKIHDAEAVVRAVVLQATADAYNAPEGDKVLFVAHEGTTVLVLQQMGEWSRVGLSNGVSGWMKRDALGEI
jgi:tetratricopeptide (TPR) repeat protein